MQCSYTEAENIPSVRILGTRVNMVELGEAVSLLEHFIRDRSRCRYVVVSSMHAVIEGFKDPAFKEMVNSADLFLPDGFGVTWIGRRSGFELESQVRGVNLMRSLCERSAQEGYRHFFYGDTEDVLNRMEQNLVERFPGIEIAGAYSPPFRALAEDEDAEIVEMINRAKPDVLWVGLGCPKQERWMYEHKGRLDVPVMVGIGAAFKFISGDVKPAPAWMSKHGVEWVWRFMHEPRRLWRRVFIYIPEFAFYASLELSGIKKWE